MMILSAIVMGDASHLDGVRTIIVRDNEEADLVKQYALRICDEPDWYLRSRLKSAPPCMRHGTATTGSS